MCAPLPIQAHGEGQGKEVDGYYIDFILEPEQPEVGTQQSILIGLEDPETLAPLAGKQLYVRISNEEGIVFSSDGFVSSDQLLTVLSFLPQTAGEYEVDIKPKGSSEKATFTFTAAENVEPTQAQGEQKFISTTSPTVIIPLLLIVGIIGFALGKRR